MYDGCATTLSTLQSLFHTKSQIQLKRIPEISNGLAWRMKKQRTHERRGWSPSADGQRWTIALKICTAWLPLRCRMHDDICWRYLFSLAHRHSASAEKYCLTSLNVAEISQELAERVRFCHQIEVWSRIHIPRFLHVWRSFGGKSVVDCRGPFLTASMSN